MNRKEFFKKSVGITCGCALFLPIGIKEFIPKNKTCNPISDDPLTPCEERVEFGKKIIIRIMNSLDKVLSDNDKIKVMRTAGRNCAIEAYGDPSTETPKTDEEINKIIDDWQKHIGEENIYRDGDILYFNYVANPNGLRVDKGYCLCPLLEDGPVNLSSTYCQCSVGYVEIMSQKYITGKKVKVTLLESLRSGGKKCRFKIELNQYFLSE